MQIDNSFVITIKPSSGLLFSDGPIPLVISVLYKGIVEVIVLGERNNFLKVDFETPNGWISKEKVSTHHLNGILPEFSLSAGESIAQIVYLHDYFNEIKPGDVMLSATISFGQKQDQDTFAKTITFRATCSLTIAGPDANQFTDRIHLIHKEIIVNPDAENRFELYKRIVSLIHPDLISILLESVLDVGLLTFHNVARNRVVDLAEHYNRREDIIEHLAKHGSLYDSQFFARWKEKRIPLSEREIERLSQSGSLWIRIYCLENYAGPYNRHGVIESVKAEVAELKERAQKLK